MARTRKRSRKPAPKTKPKYSATYATASRIVELALRLLVTGRRLSYADIRNMLRVKYGAAPAAPPSDRTIDRYVSALKAVLANGGFGELDVETYESGKKFLVFKPKSPKGGAPGESLEFLLSMNLIRSLQGTVLRENALELLGKLDEGTSGADRYGLVHLAKKFYEVPFGVKRYDDQRPVIDAIVRALLRQERLDVRYRSMTTKEGTAKLHVFEPYTLAIYKGGLYLIGYSFEREKRIFLAVERIEKVVPHLGADGEVESFTYPEGYTPELHTQGAFGIYDTGKTFDVELEILSADTIAFLAPRRFHRTQKLERRADGTAVLTMKVLGLEELATWVMTMAPWMRVVKPVELRERVKEMLASGAAVYET
jgi:predicted DNA-binding transcriptional regulator YafY